MDLSSHDIEMTVPNITDGRYWVFPVYDPFGNNIAEIGAVNGNKPGKYLVRRADDEVVSPGFINSTGELIDNVYLNKTYPAFNRTYQGVVNIPGSYATLLIRILLVANTTADLNTVHTYQNASALTPVHRTAALQSNPAPLLNSTALNGTLLGIQTPARQLEFAARIIPYNQPGVYSSRYRVASILAQAGLYSGHYHPITGVNLTQAAVIANASITSFITSPANVRQEGNDWELATVPNQGNLGTNYASAAYVALAGYQQQTVKQTLYPGYRSLGFTSQFTLATNTSYLYTFSAKPKVPAPGFWSLSMYGLDQGLIANPLDRYEVGDRTYSLQYISGGYVYGPQANSSQDGPFQILIQPVELVPPANWAGNWLPTTSTYTQILRWNVPEPAMTNGSYVYPLVQNITAIV